MNNVYFCLLTPAQWATAQAAGYLRPSSSTDPTATDDGAPFNFTLLFNDLHPSHGGAKCEHVDCTVELQIAYVFSDDDKLRSKNGALEIRSCCGMSVARNPIPLADITVLSS